MILPAGESCFVTSRAIIINQDVPLSLLEEVVIFVAQSLGWVVDPCMLLETKRKGDGGDTHHHEKHSEHW